MILTYCSVYDWGSFAKQSSHNTHLAPQCGDNAAKAMLTKFCFLTLLLNNVWGVSLVKYTRVYLCVFSGAAGRNRSRVRGGLGLCVVFLLCCKGGSGGRSGQLQGQAAAAGRAHKREQRRHAWNAGERISQDVLGIEVFTSALGWL